MITLRCANVTSLSRHSRPCAIPCQGKRGCAGRRDRDHAATYSTSLCWLLFCTAGVDLGAGQHREQQRVGGRIHQVILISMDT